MFKLLHREEHKLLVRLVVADCFPWRNEDFSTYDQRLKSVSCTAQSRMKLTSPQLHASRRTILDQT